ncbi:helix-turn-helix transcriptional regulator [Acidianus manzaensis]|uniref:HTH iclR-type domain-containing protein n=1 Tax=Acidianus manzaensis TaxID=282676 RepID=A0A1W6K2Q7_9CREN|nr:helix-turn-helix domain-containing protein [Acidianus manzaensis]ARM76806.1 hypothetical protein B6F84_12780 [Acidianus manzaensis]
MKLLLLLLVIPLLSFAVHSSSITVYYNGSVIAYANKGEFYLVGNNITDLIVIGGNYSRENNTLYLSNYSEIKYHAIFPTGVIKIYEPYNFTLSVLLPPNSDISYVSPAPLSFAEENGFLNFTFYSSNALILYSLPSSSTSSISNLDHENGFNFLLLITISGLVVTNSVLGYVLYLFRKIKKEDKEKEEEGESKEVVESTLNDRDLLVLNAINSGATTLSEIIKVTKLPKTTAYRRVKKLVSLGYIQEVRKNGKIYYQVIKKD